jgi:hypothetical protein
MSSAIPQLASIAEEFRRAVARGDYAALEACARRYTLELKACLPALPPQDQETCSRDTQALFEWARRALLVRRVQAAEELRRLRVASRYGAPPPEPASNWRLRA